MADIVDRAQKRINDDIEHALAAISRSTNSDACATGYCIDCESKIPEGRLKAQKNCLRCIECQKEYEKRQY